MNEGRQKHRQLKWLCGQQLSVVLPSWYWLSSSSFVTSTDQTGLSRHLCLQLQLLWLPGLLSASPLLMTNALLELPNLSLTMWGEPLMRLHIIGEMEEGGLMHRTHTRCYYWITLNQQGRYFVSCAATFGEFWNCYRVSVKVRRWIVVTCISGLSVACRLRSHVPVGD